MRINIELDTRNDSNILALKALVDSLANDKVIVDRGTGPLKDFDASEVTIYSTDEKGDLAKQNVNLDDGVEDVKLQTIPKGHPKKGSGWIEPPPLVEILEQGKEVVVDCGNSLSIKDSVEVVAQAVAKKVAEVVGDPTEEARTKIISPKMDTAKILDAKGNEPKPEDGKFVDVDHDATPGNPVEELAPQKPDAKKLVEAVVDAKKLVEAVVDAKTTDVDVEDTSIDEALKQLDPEPPKDEKTDHAIDIRKLMVGVIKVHGPKGAKIAGEVVNKIAGVKDVTKIPDDKIEAVKEALIAAVVPGDEPTKTSNPPSVKNVDTKSEDPTDDLEY